VRERFTRRTCACTTDVEAHPPADLDSAFGDDEDSIRLDNLRRDDDHTGEEVLVGAEGLGPSNVSGVLSNVNVFEIMRAAYGWAVA